MAYTNIPDTDVDVDSPVDTTLMTALRDNCEAVRTQILYFDLVQNSETSTSYQTQGTFRVYFPDLADYTGIQRRLTVEVELYSTPAGTAYFQVSDTTESITSTEGTTTATGWGTYVTVDLDFGSSFLGQAHVLDFTTKATSGNTTWMRIVDSYASRMGY